MPMKVVCDYCDDECGNPYYIVQGRIACLHCWRLSKERPISPLPSEQE